MRLLYYTPAPATHLETSGATLNTKGVAQALEWPESLGLVDVERMELVPVAAG